MSKSRILVFYNWGEDLGAIATNATSESDLSNNMVNLLSNNPEKWDSWSGHVQSLLEAYASLMRYYPSKNTDYGLLTRVPISDTEDAICLINPFAINIPDLRESIVWSVNFSH